jgi:hypothetical protein
MFLKTAEQWWNLLDKYKGDIVAIANRTNKPFTDFYPLGLKGFDEAVERRDPLVADVLFDIWDAVPNIAAIHTWKGWDILCELSAESHLIRGV